MSKLRLSHDHHYVPRCYLRGFCRSDRTFDVYDKTYRKFKKALQSPGTVFFERRRNTEALRGQNTDKIETTFAGIEPGIGHLKSDGRLSRNFPKGTEGDAINAILSGVGHNIRKILRQLALFIVLRLIAIGRCYRHSVSQSRSSTFAAV